MKPGRLLLSVAPLPTITESHEDLSQSLEEYMNSIKELAQPACGPLRISRTQRRKPAGKHVGSTSTSRSTSRALQPRHASLGLDEVMVSFNSQVDHGTKDPLDWLFAQTHLQSHGEDLRRTDIAPAQRVLNERYDSDLPPEDGGNMLIISVFFSSIIMNHTNVTIRNAY
uniref:Protein DEPP n=1 Tax=Cyprinus carpio TaxID=7962 RepID=A0A8C1GWG9_CYPCA